MHGYELLDRVPELAGVAGQADVGNLYRVLRALERTHHVIAAFLARYGEGR